METAQKQKISTDWRWSVLGELQALPCSAETVLMIIAHVMLADGWFEQQPDGRYRIIFDEED